MITELSIERVVSMSGVGALVIPIIHADSSPIQIMEMDGLGPVKADITSEKNIRRSGEYRTGGNIGKRNITLSLRLNPDWATQTMAELRRILYQYFLPSNTVAITFSSDDLEDVSIVGEVESMEPNQFNEDPQIDISILCFDPNFESSLVGSLTGSFDNTGFEETIELLGTETVGFVLSISRDSTYGNYDGPIELWSDYPGESMILDPIHITSAHSLGISTVSGDRYIRDYFSTLDTVDEVLYLMDPTSTWVQLSPGDNALRFKTNDTGRVLFDLSYKQYYGGL